MKKIVSNKFDPEVDRSADVTIICAFERFRVHKPFIWLVSLVFGTMLDSPIRMREGKELHDQLHLERR